MKWVFAFNQQGEDWYLDLVRVAVLSAQQNTTLEPYCLYDGEETAFTVWLRERGVRIILCRSVFYTRLEELANRRNDLNYLRIGSGAFLRFELPRVAREQGWTDEYVLYTDCDVMFLRNPVPLLKVQKVRFFGAVPEAWQHKKLHMNSGVMWINMKGLGGEMEKLQQFTFQHLERVVALSWDQGALRVYFDPLHRLTWKLKIPDRVFYAVMTRLPLKCWRWDDISPTLNWKPYWGESEEAAIVHFHALKPYRHLKNDIKAGNQYNTEGYRKYAAQWQNWLKNAN